MTFLEMVEVIYHSTLNKYRYSEQINFVNLWLDKQAIGFIFPIHYLKPPFKSKGGFLCLDNSKFFPLVSIKFNPKNYTSIKNIYTVTF